MSKLLKIMSVLFVIMFGISFLIFRSAKKNEKINNMMSGDIPEVDKDRPENIQTATFSLGCFWGPDAKFGTIEGVIRTRVGYAGGDKKNPTYHNLGKHTETIQIDYNPDKITYKQLLNIFWESHNPTVQSSTQYMSRIFYHDDFQKDIAEESRDKLERENNIDIKTEISRFEKFYPAEDYHQKYYLKQHKDFLTIYKKIYPDNEEFLRSTAVSRVNGYVVGDGELSGPDNLYGLGLSEDGRQKLFDDWMEAQNYYGDSCPNPYT